MHSNDCGRSSIGRAIGDPSVDAGSTPAARSTSQPDATQVTAQRGEHVVEKTEVHALKQILIQKHYAHKAPSGKTHYFKYEDAVIAISIPANNNVSKWLLGEKNRVWELSRMWAPDGHRRSLLTEAIAYAVNEFKKLEPEVWALISYADPNGDEQSGQRAHEGTVYRAASWTYLGQCEDGRYFRCAKTGQVHARRTFHMGRKFIRDSEIVALGYVKHNLPGKHRFARGLNRKARKLILAKAATLNLTKGVKKDGGASLRVAQSLL